MAIRRGQLRALVNDYIERHRPCKDIELNSFRRERSLDAVRRAGVARDGDGHKYSHQRRLHGKTLDQSASVLRESAEELENCTTFAELHLTIQRLLGGFPGLGDLYYYDTALRIGAHLGARPEAIYLHRGTREGAKAFGLNWRDTAVAVGSFPRVIRENLKPHEIEDFLCIYKKDLKLLAEGKTLSDLRKRSACALVKPDSACC